MTGRLVLDRHRCRRYCVRGFDAYELVKTLRRREDYSATILEMRNATYEAVYLPGDFYLVTSRLRALKDVLGIRHSNRSMEDEKALRPGRVTHVHRARVVARLHHDDALS